MQLQFRTWRLFVPLFYKAAKQYEILQVYISALGSPCNGGLTDALDLMEAILNIFCNFMFARVMLMSTLLWASAKRKSALTRK
ncbi:hypothetical protein C0J52_24412 [Blattella germanica]|nr:hypothetical protein C0J52_24412 [Blattella germanica]